MSDTASHATSRTDKTDRLIELINALIAQLDYEVVHLEIQTHRQKILRVFIDRLGSEKQTAIGIEDCVKVTRALDEPLDQVPEITEIFHGNYELEVSSPGVDRPLRQPKDFQRFSGRDVRIHVFRPLTGEELGNSDYQERNPRQKNFLGTLKGIVKDRVLLAIGGTELKKEEISIPLPLISKANLEPNFEEERETV